MSRQIARPYSGKGYLCEACGVHVNQRKRYDRPNWCLECGITRMIMYFNWMRDFGKAAFNVYCEQQRAAQASSVS